MQELGIQLVFKVILGGYFGVSRCMCAVGIWAEVELNSRIMDKSSNINDFLDSVFSSQSASVRPALHPLI